MAKKKKQEELIDENFVENIQEVDFAEVMQKAYIDYSMSVITDRALPDARDGFKPVQRRILYDMYDLGVSADKPHKKSARISGDVIGKYHPHSQDAVYGAMVVMAQDFKQGRILIDGHGNYGSNEGDPPAAARYTECRLESFTEDVFLSELKNDTVPFVPNYDETLKEPAVLPAKLPNLLINGTEGIAVGMAAYAPPHAIGDVADTCIYALNNPKASNADLLNVLKGPDFPTGGIVSNKSDLLNIYSTGNGKIKIRGKMHVEEDKGGRSKLIITEIPYTMIGEGINKFLQSVADLVENKTLTDIIDISNQSSKEGIRLVIELKRGADVEYIKNVLYKKTKLEDTFGMNMLAVWNGRPCTMSLVDIMTCYKDFQHEIYEKKFQKLLQKAEKQREIDEGLVKAIDAIDTIIAIFKGSKNTAQAKNCLMTGDTTGIDFKNATLEKKASKFNFTEIQSQAILDMKMQRLIGLELNALVKELETLNKNIAHYNKVLTSKNALTKEIVKELERIKEKYATPRKTELIDAEEIVIKEPKKKEEPCFVLVDEKSYIHVIDYATYERNKESAHKDYAYVVPTTNFSKILMFTNLGNMHSLKVADIPFGRYKDKGVPIDNISNFVIISEKLVGMSSLTPEKQYLIATKNGLVKRIEAKELDVSRKTVACINITDDELATVCEVLETDMVLFHSENDKWGKMKASDIPVYGRGAKGCVGVLLEDNDKVKEVFTCFNHIETVNVDNKDVRLNMIIDISRGNGKLSYSLLNEAEMKKAKRKKPAPKAKKNAKK